MAGALQWLGERDPTDRFAYVVTPNVDHVVRLAREPRDGVVFRAYRGAELCLCDSRVLARLAAACGVELPVVPGSDLTRTLLLRELAPGDRLCLIGGDASLAAELAQTLPAVAIVHEQPPMGLRHDEAALDAAAAAAAAARARFTLIAVGSPQQELLAARIAARGDACGIGLCIGASIEFVTGAKRRAPAWMQRAGIEWAHRLASEPRRLWRRYLLEGPRIFAMTLRWRRERRSAGR